MKVEPDCLTDIGLESIEMDLRQTGFDILTLAKTAQLQTPSLGVVAVAQESEFGAAQNLCDTGPVQLFEAEDRDGLEGGDGVCVHDGCPFL